MNSDHFVVLIILQLQFLPDDVQHFEQDKVGKLRVSHSHIDNFQFFVLTLHLLAHIGNEIVLIISVYDLIGVGFAKEIVYSTSVLLDF